MEGDGASVSPVVAALAGVVVGGILNFALAQIAGWRQDRRVTRGIARLLDRGFLIAILAVDDALKSKKWPPESSDFRFQTEGWPEYRVELARIVHEDWEFDPIDDAFRLLALENERLVAGRASYDGERLKKLFDQIQAARIVLSWHSDSTRKRLRRHMSGAVSKAARPFRKIVERRA